MAEEQQQQSKGIGELFVEFGAKGLPTLLKGMNAVSASFLLGKNAANQFVQTLSKPVKEAGQAAVQFGKMSNALGISLQEYMKLHLYLKSHNLSDSLLNDLGSISNMLTEVQMGIGGLDAGFAYAMHTLGLSWTDYDGSVDSILQLTKDVQKATEGMDATRKRVLMQKIGLGNPEWQYAFERGDFNLSDYKNISDEEVNELIKSQEAIAKAAAEFEQFKMHLVSKLTPAVETIANFVSDKAGKAAQGNYDKPVKDAAVKTITAGGSTATRSILANPIAIPLVVGAGLYGTFKNLINQTKTQGHPTGGAAPIVPPSLQGTAHIPPNLNNSNTTIQVTNENHVSVATPQDVGPAISSISRDTMRNIEYSEFQTINRPGL